MDSRIIFKTEDRVGKLIFNNPSKLNSFDFEMIQELNKILDRIKNSSLKAVVITGTGHSFCTGGDISWELEAGKIPKAEAKKQINFVQKTFSKIESLPQIIIALINGYAIGGGNELAMACDIRIALESAKFLHPEVSLGTVAPLGATKRLPRLIGLGKAKYMLLTGEIIDSATALKWGLVDFLVPRKKIGGFMDSLLQKITRNPMQPIALTKKSVNSSYRKDMVDKFEADSYIKCSASKENRELLDNFFRNKNR